MLKLEQGFGASLTQLLDICGCVCDLMLLFGLLYWLRMLIMPVGWVFLTDNWSYSLSLLWPLLTCLLPLDMPTQYEWEEATPLSLSAKNPSAWRVQTGRRGRERVWRGELELIFQSCVRLCVCVSNMYLSWNITFNLQKMSFDKLGALWIQGHCEFKDSQTLRPASVQTHSLLHCRHRGTSYQ